MLFTLARGGQTAQRSRLEISVKSEGRSFAWNEAAFPRREANSALRDSAVFAVEI
jgi:hypothetical protein